MLTASARYDRTSNDAEMTARSNADRDGNAYDADSQLRRGTMRRNRHCSRTESWDSASTGVRRQSQVRCRTGMGLLQKVTIKSDARQSGLLISISLHQLSCR